MIMIMVANDDMITAVMGCRSDLGYHDDDT